MIVILYDPPQFARFYTGFATKYPLQFAQEADTRTIQEFYKPYRTIQGAKMVRPPVSGYGYCVDCVRKFEFEDIGLYHQGHLVDIRNLQFNRIEPGTSSDE